MIPLLLFLLSFAFYLRGASPTLYGGDSGELIASAHLLGVPHAPGYPVYNLLGKAAMVLIPWANPAYRGAVFCALVSSAVIVLFFLTIKRVAGEGNSIGLFCSLILATTPLFIEQARVVEVFGLNALFVAAILLCLIQTNDQRLMLASFLFGLGMGNHHTLVMLLPLFVGVWWSGSKRVSVLLWCAFFFLAGLSVYLYLPIRARMNPAVNFGDPETLHRFWSVFTRKVFGTTSLHPAAVPFRDLPLLLQHAQRFGERFFSSFGFTGVLLTIAGGCIAFLQKPHRLLASIALFYGLLLAFGFEVISNLSPQSDIGQWRLERFFLMPSLFIVLLMAIVFASLLKADSRFLRWASMILFAAFVIERSAARPWRMSFRDNFLFHDFAVSTLRSAPSGSVVVIDRVLFDEPTSSLLVETNVHGKRPDVRFLYRPGTLFEPVYGEDILEVPWQERLKRQKAMEASLLDRSKHVRCLAFEKANTPFEVPELEGLLYKERQEKETKVLESLILINRDHLAIPFDYPRRLMKVHIPYFLGKSHLERADSLSAQKWFGSALRTGSDMAWFLANLGSLSSGQDDIGQAERYFLKTVKMDFYFYEGHYGLGYVAIKKGEHERAIAEYRLATKLAPQNPDGFYMLGVAFSLANQHQNARGAWETYLRLDPNGPMAPAVRERMHR